MLASKGELRLVRDPVYDLNYFGCHGFWPSKFYPQLISTVCDLDVPRQQVAREDTLDKLGKCGPDPREAAVGDLGAVGLREVVLGRYAVLGVGHVVRELLHVDLIDGCEHV